MILVNEALIQHLQHPNEVAFRLIDRVQVRGRTEATELYEVLGTQSDVEQRKATLTTFQQAWNFYQQGDFAKAARLYQALLQQNPQDRPSAILLQRCQDYQKNPPETWNGVVELLIK